MKQKLQTPLISKLRKWSLLGALITTIHLFLFWIILPMTSSILSGFPLFYSFEKQVEHLADLIFQLFILLGLTIALGTMMFFIAAAISLRQSAADRWNNKGFWLTLLLFPLVIFAVFYYGDYVRSWLIWSYR